MSSYRRKVKHIGTTKYKYIYKVKYITGLWKDQHGFYINHPKLTKYYTKKTDKECAIILDIFLMKRGFDPINIYKKKHVKSN